MDRLSTMTADDTNSLAHVKSPPGVDTQPFAQQGEAISFRYIIAAIRSNLTLIATIMMVTLAAGVIVTLLQTPRFKASASIQINNATNRVLKSQDDDQSDETMGGASDTDRFLKTQVAVLQSRGMAERVIQRLDLMHSQQFYAASSLKLPANTATEAQKTEQVIKVLSKNLDVSLPHDSRIATITYVSNDPKMAADIANAFSSEFIQFSLKRKFDSSAYARDFLSSQLQQTKGKLEESERALNAYARNAGIIRFQRPGGSESNGGSAGDQSVTTASLLQLNQAANDAKARRIAAEARWKAINAGPLLSASEVMSNVGISQLLTQRAALESALEDDRARHLDDYPTVKSKKEALAATNKLIQQSAINIRNGVKAEFTAASQAESDLQRQADAAKASMLNEQDSNVQFGLLAREVDTNRQVYDGLLQRYKELNAAAGITISNILVVDTAEPPLRPYSPNLWYNLAIAFAFGLVLVVIVVAVKDQFDDSIRIPEEIETKLGISLLGVIPQAHSSNPVEELEDPKSSISEAYNSLRGSLIYSTPGGLPKVMLITSAQPSEGKSTTSMAVATGLARMGKTVILIDADMRRPSLHRQIDSDNAEGLSSLLTSGMSPMDVMRATSQPNLSVITSGPVPPSPTELISSTRMREMINQLAQRFDTVLIDCPPVLGLADAPMMAAIVDGVVFVVEADRSRHGSLKTALRRLRSVAPNLLGGVLTKFDPLRSGNRYSSYYGYEYYQYSYGDKGQ